MSTVINRGYKLHKGATVFGFLDELKALKSDVVKSNIYTLIETAIRDWDNARYADLTDSDFREYLSEHKENLIEALSNVFDVPSFTFVNEGDVVYVVGFGYGDNLGNLILNFDSVEQDYSYWNSSDSQLTGDDAISEEEWLSRGDFWKNHLNGETGLMFHLLSEYEKTMPLDTVMSYVLTCPGCEPRIRIDQLCKKISLDEHIQVQSKQGAPVSDLIASATSHMMSGYPGWEKNREKVSIDFPVPAE